VTGVKSLFLTALTEYVNFPLFNILKEDAVSKRNIFKESTMPVAKMEKSVKTTAEVAASDQPQEVSHVSGNQPTADFTESQQFESVIGRATEVFANQQKALRWLGTPVRALEYATPISLLGRSDGRSAVLKVLDKIEHGVL
jgi:uncharacterized protein (DUF2384 family)